IRPCRIVNCSVVRALKRACSPGPCEPPFRQPDDSPGPLRSKTIAIALWFSFTKSKRQRGNRYEKTPAIAGGASVRSVWPPWKRQGDRRRGGSDERCGKPADPAYRGHARRAVA